MGQRDKQVKFFETNKYKTQHTIILANEIQGFFSRIQMGFNIKKINRCNKPHF